VRLRRYARPVVAGGLVAAAGTLPWVLLARWNAHLRPDVPWAALLTLGYLAILLAWLNGVGPPRRTAANRRQHLRLWPTTVAVGEEGLAGSSSDRLDAHARPPIGGERLRAALPFLLGLALLTVLWIAIGRPEAAPDVSAYPTTAHRWSVFVIGALVSGVVEEAAFRGYMQRGLEPYGRERAVLITSAIFTLVHGVHGLGALLLLGPGIFAASVLYGAMALRTGTIIPGMVAHTLGDLAFTYFGTLRGDGSLLFVTWAEVGAVVGAA
jgi:membrane protease YdiL (CAAX protease family)